jgi:glycosyltransferase involved in cell wall biosynthesis
MNFLSVIIPTYNSEKTIERCLVSLFQQSYKNFEICIIDGCSTDDTLNILNKDYFHVINLRIFSSPDKGVYDAMNKGVKVANGDWLYFLGSDDEIFDENVFLDILSLEIHPKTGIIYGNVLSKDKTPWSEESQVYDGFFDYKKLFKQNISHQSIFYRKTLFEKFGYYESKYIVCADWEINLRFYVRTRSIFVDRIIAIFYGDGLSSKTSDISFGRDSKFLRVKFLIEYFFFYLMSSLFDY